MSARSMVIGALLVAGVCSRAQSYVEPISSRFLEGQKVNKTLTTGVI